MSRSCSLGYRKLAIFRQQPGCECKWPYNINDPFHAREALFRIPNMDKLLALIAQADDEEDVVVQFRDAVWSDSSMSLRLAISVFDSPPENWHVLCEDVVAYQLNGEGSHWLELLNDHPLLWEFKHDSASAYFYRAPADADAAVGALYEVHRKAVGVWIRFGRYLNNEADLVKLLNAGNGLLAEAPMPLLALYKDALRLHGLELDIRFSHPPRIWNGSKWQHLPLENATKALVLGTSYVIGSGWKAEKLDDAPGPSQQEATPAVG